MIAATGRGHRARQAIGADVRSASTTASHFGCPHEGSPLTRIGSTELTASTTASRTSPAPCTRGSRTKDRGLRFMRRRYRGPVPNASTMRRKQNSPARGRRFRQNGRGRSRNRFVASERQQPRQRRHAMNKVILPRLGAASGAVFAVALFVAVGNGDNSFSTPRAIAAVVAITLALPFVGYVSRL